MKTTIIRVGAVGLFLAILFDSTAGASTTTGPASRNMTAIHRSESPKTTAKQSASGSRTWHLVFTDDFNGKVGTAPNPKYWTYDIGRGPNNDGWGNNELEYYTNSTKNAFLDGSGHLIIRAIKQKDPNRPYTSARIVSRNSANWTYGKIDVRAKLPTGGQGIWPAIWMLPTDWKYGGWPASGEIDIMEMIGSDPLTVHGTIHFGSEGNDTYLGAQYTLPNSGFHDYTLVWAPKSIQFYVDGHLYETRTSKEWFSGNAPAPAPFNQRFHLLMNLAVGGNWPGYPDGTVKFPQEMMVDYVHVYQLK